MDIHTICWLSEGSEARCAPTKIPIHCQTRHRLEMQQAAMNIFKQFKLQDKNLCLGQRRIVVIYSGYQNHSIN